MVWNDIKRISDSVQSNGNLKAMFVSVRRHKGCDEYLHQWYTAVEEVVFNGIL